MKEAGETLKRQFELALCTSVAERKEYETTVENLHAQMDQQRMAAASKLGITVEKYETKIAVLTKVKFVPLYRCLIWFLDVIIPCKMCNIRFCVTYPFYSERRYVCIPLALKLPS